MSPRVQVLIARCPRCGSARLHVIVRMEAAVRLHAVHVDPKTGEVTKHPEGWTDPWYETGVPTAVRCDACRWESPRHDEPAEVDALLRDLARAPMTARPIAAHGAPA